MATKKSSQPSTKKVRQTTVEEFEAPVVEPEESEPIEVDVDPLDEFFDEIDASRTLTMHVWELTAYKQNGLKGRRAPGAKWTCMFPFSEADTETYRATIQTWQPSGGMFYIEVREGGRGIVKSWSEEVGPIPGQAPATNTAPHSPYAPVIVHQHPNQQQQQGMPMQPVDPREMFREQMAFVRDVVQISKDLQPPTQPTVAGDPQVEILKARMDFTDKLLGLADKNPSLAERLLSKLVGADEPQADSGASSWVGLATELVKGLPSIIESIARYAPMMQARGNGASGVQLATIGGTATGAALPPAPLNSQQPQPQQQQPAQQLDPITQRWQNVVRRLVEDLLNDTSVDASVNAIADLYEQVPETREVIKGLMSAKPEELLVMCARITATSQEEYVSISSLTRHRASINWVVELQAGARETLESIETESEPELELEEKESGE